MATLTHARRSQTEMASPNPHAQPFSPQPDGETIPKQLRSAAPTAVKRRQHLQSPTLRTPQRSQTEMATPNPYAHGPSAETDGTDSPKSLHSAALSVAKQRNHTQTATLTALTAAICGSPPQMATLTHAQRIQPEKPSPTVYAHQPPSADRWKRLPQIPTLSRPQRSQLEKPHPDRYAGNCPARIETGQSSAAQDHNPQTHKPT